MNRYKLFLVILTALYLNEVHSMSQTLYDFKVKTPSNTEQSLDLYRDKVVLVVNVASKCGFTPQYEGLEKLFKTYQEKGFVILGFPSNQFGAQEPGSNEEIQKFCKVNFGVTFPIFAKIDVNGEHSIPLYTWLKSSAPGVLGTEAIKWNFTKFLIDRKGHVVKRFAPATKPDSLAKEVEQLL